MDGERTAVEERLLEAHLVACPGCRDWVEAAHEVTRRARLGLLDAPDLASDIAAAWTRRTDSSGWQVLRRAGWVRVALLMLALGQAAITFPSLWLGHDTDVATHPAHELGSLGIAFAVAFASAALRPARSRALAPIVGVAGVALCTTAAVDLASGRTNVTDELPHVLVVAGWLLLWRLSRTDHGRPHTVPLLRRLHVFAIRSRLATPPVSPNPTERSNAPSTRTSAVARKSAAGAG